MEFETKVKNLPEIIKKLGMPPETSVRFVIEEIKTTPNDTRTKTFIPFLDDNDFWDHEDTPTDLSANIDKYVYDE